MTSEYLKVATEKDVGVVKKSFITESIIVTFLVLTLSIMTIELITNTPNRAKQNICYMPPISGQT